MSAAALRAKCSWGVASARHVSGVVVRGEESPFLFDAPLGPSVVRWDLQKEEITTQFQAHSDLIVCMRLSPDCSAIATAGSGGEVKLWNTNWELVAKAVTPVESLFHLAWSDSSDRFLVVSNGFKSSVLMYDVTKSSDSSKLSLKLSWHVSAGQFPSRDPSIEQQEEDLSEKSRTGREYHYGDLFYMGEINHNGTSLVVEEREGACTMTHLYSAEGKLLKSSRLKSLDRTKEVHTLMISSSNNGCYVIMTQGGFALVIKGEELEIMNTIKIDYTSRTCVWDEDLIVLPSDSGKLTWVDIKSGKKVCEFKVMSSDFVVHIDWSVGGDSLWVCGFSKLSYCPVTRDEKGVVTGVSTKYSFSTHEISCCGVGFSPDSTHLAVGDLAGSVYLYGCETDLCHPLELWNVGASVRCLTWMNSTEIVIGCLDGLVHLWHIGEGIKIYFALEGSILHLRVSNNRKYLAVGTSHGKVGVFSLEGGHHNDSVVGGAYGSLVCPVSVFVAHKPQPGRNDTRFGQLGKQAEVWSLCWSPDDKLLATCSEDQTVRIWEAGSWVAVTTLTGHSLAVTSVDWRIVCDQNLLVSCSDDRTIRVYSADRDYQLLHTMSTKEIHGWHTLTYLALTPKQEPPQVMVTTQHGYLVLFNVLTGEMVLKDKMHCGSVEGLVWEGFRSRLATVGGDCAAYVWKLEL